MTPNQITSTIRNNIADGLSGAIANHAYSLEQMLAEVDLLRAKLLYEYIGALGTKKVNLKYHMQTMDPLLVECRDFALIPSECNLPSGLTVPSIKVPKIMATPDDSGVGYLGYIDRSKNFTFYSNVNDITNHKRRVYTSSTPYAWSDMTTDDRGLMTILLFNMGEYNPLSKILFTGLLDQPRSILTLDPDALDKEYPAPAGFQEDIIVRLSERYIRYYRQLNVMQPANTQTDPIT